MFTERTSVGLDVHARSVAAAAIDGVTGELFQSRLTPSYEHVRSWLGRLPGPVAVVYPDAVWYTYVDQHDIDEIVDSHLKQGKPVERLKLAPNVGR